MKFSLWDTETSNQFGQYEDEAEVLALVRTLVGYYGEGYADDLGLGRIDDAGKDLEPLTGTALLARADEVLGNRHHEDQGKDSVVSSRFTANV